MKSKSMFRILKAIDGRTIHILEEDDKPGKPHCITGPAIIYPESDKKASEYYLFGIKYEKDRWTELSSALRKSKPKEDFSI